MSKLSKIEDSSSVQKTADEKLYDKINSITNSCTKSYFNQILKRLADKNPTNASIMYDYIVAEQTELNIKNSTKEGKIRTLVWLSNFFDDKILFKEMSMSLKGAMYI